MEDALMSGIPEALTIWLALLGVSLLAFALLAVVAGRTRPRSARVGAGPPAAHPPRIAITRLALALAKDATQTRPPQPQPTIDDELRFAGEVATAAARAAVTAERRNTEWVCAQRAVDAAWQAYEAADRAARRAIRAEAFPTPATPLTPAEYATRERHLHRGAQAAHARGELSTDQLIDAMSHRNGFDPRAHPFEQDAMLRRTARDRLLRVYLTASDLERTAWREADLAVAAKLSLDREATNAARRVQETHRLPSRTGLLAARPRLAVRGETDDGRRIRRLGRPHLVGPHLERAHLVGPHVERRLLERRDLGVTR
jgi:hypothetical protein